MGNGKDVWELRSMFGLAGLSCLYCRVLSLVMVNILGSLQLCCGSHKNFLAC